jgi:hypothetical protein
MSTLLTISGRRINPLEPRVEDIDAVDIAASLSKQCRYLGHVPYFYSVAEHSVLVSRHVDPAVAREALMHDATEAYLGDIIRPLKRLPAFAAYREIEDRLALVIAEKFKLRTDDAALAEVKRVDDAILADEIRALRHFDPGRAAPDAKLGAEILCYTPARGEVLFLARFGELFPEFVDARAIAIDMEIL